MINLIFVNESCQNSLFLDKIQKSKSVLKHIEGPKSEKVKRERNISYSALVYLLRYFFDISSPDINFIAKPYLVDKEQSVSFNISHTDGAIIIALSDEYPSVGVDIEKVMDAGIAKRINKRFLSSEEVFDMSAPLAEKVNFFSLCYEGGEPHLYKIPKNEEVKMDKLPKPHIPRLLKENQALPKNGENDAYSTTTRFTLLESLLKCEGGGFSSISRWTEIKKDCECVSFWFSVSGRDFSVSLSCMK